MECGKDNEKSGHQQAGFGVRVWSVNRKLRSACSSTKIIEIKAHTKPCTKHQKQNKKRTNTNTVTPWLHHRPELFDGVIRVIFTQYTSIVHLSTATANRDYRPSAMLSTQDTRNKAQRKSKSGGCVGSTRKHHALPFALPRL